ncbi:hypothetical protein [Robinsoniella sp. KNHs210]
MQMAGMNFHTRSST